MSEVVLNARFEKIKNDHSLCRQTPGCTKENHKISTVMRFWAENLTQVTQL